jgi:enoyl-[acyl-carrier protein] reductase I
MGLLENKQGLVIGVANHRSIAWAICRSLATAGARLAVTYQNERLEATVRKLASELPGAHVMPCDLMVEDDVTRLYEDLGRTFGRLDFLVHSVAFARTEDLSGRFVDTSREGFDTAMAVSVYSLVAATRGALPLMAQGGSVVTMTYLGSQRVVPNYNVMGVAKAALEASVRYLAADVGPQNVRVNAISAGPINTLSARAISDLHSALETVRSRAPLRRNTEQAEVGDTALFLCSDLSRGITGEIVFVDSGYHALGI